MHAKGEGLCRNRVGKGRMGGRVLEPRATPGGHPFPEGGRGTHHTPYLFCSHHGNHIDPLLPYHLPEVMARVRQGPLSRDVVPLGPSNHHLQPRKYWQMSPRSRGSCANPCSCAATFELGGTHGPNGSVTASDILLHRDAFCHSNPSKCINLICACL